MEEGTEVTQEVGTTQESGDSMESQAEPLSFDDLDDAPAQVKTPAPKAKAGESEEDEEGEPEAEAGKENTEDGKESKEAGSEEEADKPESKEKIKQSGTEKVKTLKVRSGDKDLELRTDTAFEVTIAGKKESVPLQDLLTNYSGKVDYSRKYSEFDKDKKSFHAEKKDLEDSLNRLYDLATKQSNPKAAIMHLAETMGADGHETWKALVQEIRKTFDASKDLTPEQIKARELEEENEYLRKKGADKAAAEKTKADEAHVSDRVTAIREQHGIDEKTFFEIYNDLKDAVKQGQLKAEKLTPEFVGEYYAETKVLHDLGKMVSEVNPELPKKNEAVQELRKIMVQNPELSMKDIREIAAETFKPKKKGPSKFVEKVKQSRSSGSASAATQENEPLTFDDLED
jgi:hypothetical protein